MSEISSQDLGANAAGDIYPLAGFALTASRSTDAWRLEVMKALKLLGATDKTTA